MQDIGNKLKNERIAQNQTIEDIMAKTRFSRSQIEAIETGNLDFFKDDITYVRYYIQFYCKALKVDFSDYKDDLDETMITYTKMLSEKEILDLKKANEEMQKRIQRNVTLNKAKPKNKKRKRKIDVSLISFLGIVLVVIMGLSIAFGKYVFPSLLDGQDQIHLPAVSTDETEKVTTTSDQSNVSSNASSDTDVVSKIIVTKKDAHHYVISNYVANEIINLKIEFNIRTWIDAYLNKERVLEPESNKIYAPNSTATYTFEAKSNTTLELRLGYVKSNVFYVNNQLLELDSSVASLQGSNTIYIEIEGE